MRAFLITLLIFTTSTTWAAEQHTDFALVPQAIQDSLLKEFPQGKFRIDGCFENQGQLWLAIRPLNQSTSTTIALKEKTKTLDFLFDNGWIFTPIENNTVKSFDFFPLSFQESLVKGQILESFVIPKEFTLPRDLSILSGRLPIPLRSVELASNRELRYTQRLKEESQKAPVNFISYSRGDGSINFINVLESNGSLNYNDNLNNDFERLNADLSFVSKIKKIDGDIYLADYNKGIIHKITHETKEPDAKIAYEQIQEPSRFQVEEVVDLHNFEIKSKLKDFILSKETQLLYILTELEPELLIINSKNQALLKRIKVESNSDNLLLAKRNFNEANQVLFFSKSPSSLTSVNSFDHRIASTFQIDHKEASYQILPITMSITPEYLFIAGEKINRNSVTNITGTVLALDSVSGNKVMELDLNFIPSKILLSKDEATLLVLGHDKEGIGYLNKLNIHDLTISSSLNLGVDLSSPADMTSSESGGFLIITSSKNKVLGIVDYEKLELVKKFDINKAADLVLAL